MSVADLLLSHTDGISVWPYSGKGPGEPEGPHSHLNPPHMTNALLRGLSSSLPCSLYTYLTISKLGITNSNHLNYWSTVREITANYVFTGGYQKATAFIAKLLLFYVPLSHSGVSSLCNLLSRGEAYKFPVHPPSSFCPWKLRSAGSKLGSSGSTREQQNQRRDL